MSARPDPLALATLGPDDPALADADPRELAAARRVIEAVDAAPLPPGPSAIALSRTLDAVMAEWPEPRSMGARMRSSMLLPATLMASVALAFLLVRPEGTVAFATWHCAPAEMLCGLLPFAIAFMAHRRRGGEVSALSLGGWAAVGALLGQVAMLRLCLGRDLDHLLTFHVGGVLCSALAGALLSRPLEWVFARR
jgi:hypothetical protein